MQYIKDIKDSQEVDECYLIQSKQVNTDKNGKIYISLTLKDKTGKVDARVWNCDKECAKNFRENTYIKIHGSAHMFNNVPQLSIKKYEFIDESKVDKAEYTPTTYKDVDLMIDELFQIIDGVKNPFLNWLLSKVFIEDDNFIKEFSKKSAAKNVHHNYQSGLLEHSINVAHFSKEVAARYKVDEDITVTIALLHDIGKVKELSDFPQNDYTEEGKLFGHIILGYQMIHEIISQNEEFPEELKNRIEHAILSHHGEYEYGSPKRPKTIEALIVHFCDNVDAKINTFMLALENTTNDQTGWTDYNKYFARQLKK